MRAWRIFGLSCFLPLLCGCGSDDTEGVAEPATSMVLYGPAAETDLTPFPSNRYTVADPSKPTGVRVAIGKDNTADPLLTTDSTTIATALAELNELDGFSTTGGVIIKVSAPIDATGIEKLPIGDPIADEISADAYRQKDSPLLLVNVDESSPEHGQAVGIVPRWAEFPKDVDFLVDEFTLLAQPAVPLRPKTRYALAITDRLEASDGTPVGPSQDMRKALTSSSDPYAIELRKSLADLEQSVGIEKRHVVGGTVFTTASVQSEIVEMAKARRAAAAPALGDPWTIETAQTAPDLRVRFRATYGSPEFRKPKPDGKWQIDASGAPVTQKQESLEVFLALSDATKSGPRPVVIFQHGLGGDKDGCWGSAERLAQIAANGAAVFAIDSPEHGSRGGASSQVSSVYGFFGIDQQTLEFDIGRARDNFRQMAADQLELVRFIEGLASLDLLPLDANGNPAPDGKPDLDVSHIYYIGHSFGSVQGATIFALAPEIAAATWNVGGAGLMMLLRDSKLFSIIVKGLAPPGTSFGAVARFMAITQAIVDPGDPLNYARNATLEPLDGVSGWTGRDVLLQEVVDDNIVPNTTSEALARAAGLAILNRKNVASGLTEVSAPVSANLQSGGTGVLCQFDTMNGGTTATHGELLFSTEGQAQYAEFFKTAIANGRASVKAPY